MARAEKAKGEADVRLAALAAAAAFRAADWRWAGDYVPSWRDIEQTIVELAAALAGEGWSMGTGRLHVEWGEDGDLHLSLDLGSVEEFFSEPGA